MEDAAMGYMSALRAALGFGPRTTTRQAKGTDSFGHYKPSSNPLGDGGESNRGPHPGADPRRHDTNIKIWKGIVPLPTDGPLPGPPRDPGSVAFRSVE